jgi:hypothetical protein
MGILISNQTIIYLLKFEGTNGAIKLISMILVGAESVFVKK